MNSSDNAKIPKTPYLCAANTNVTPCVFFQGPPSRRPASERRQRRTAAVLVEAGGEASDGHPGQAADAQPDERRHALRADARQSQAQWITFEFGGLFKRDCVWSRLFPAKINIPRQRRDRLAWLS